MRCTPQINDRMYAADFWDDYDDILCYGIAFFKKRCMVRKKQSSAGEYLRTLPLYRWNRLRSAKVLALAVLFAYTVKC